jgi:hypothetical protein
MTCHFFTYLTRPVTPQAIQNQISHLSQFIAFMSMDGLTSGTIQSYINGIKKSHLQSLRVDVIPEKAYLQLLIDGIKNIEDTAGITTKRKFPFTWEMLMACQSFYNLDNINQLEEFTLIATGIGFLLRASELMDDKKTNHYLRREDVKFNFSRKGYLQSVTITVRSSKTSRVSVWRSLGYTGNRTGVAALLFKYYQATKLRQPHSPLFPSFTRHKLSTVIKSLAVRLGYHGDTSIFSSHLLRRGGATSLLNVYYPMC